MIPISAGGLALAEQYLKVKNSLLNERYSLFKSLVSTWSLRQAAWVFIFILQKIRKLKTPKLAKKLNNISHNKLLKECYQWTWKIILLGVKRFE